MYQISSADVTVHLKLMAYYLYSTVIVITQAATAYKLREGKYRINWHIRPPFFTGPPPHIRPVLFWVKVFNATTNFS
jgi:hypothetical protein